MPMVSGEIVGIEDGSGRCLFVMRVMLKLGALSSEGLSTASRKRVCVECKSEKQETI